MGSSYSHQGDTEFNFYLISLIKNSQKNINNTKGKTITSIIIEFLNASIPVMESFLSTLLTLYEILLVFVFVPMVTK